MTEWQRILDRAAAGEYMHPDALAMARAALAGVA